MRFRCSWKVTRYHTCQDASPRTRPVHAGMPFGAYDLGWDCKSGKSSSQRSEAGGSPDALACSSSLRSSTRRTLPEMVFGNSQNSILEMRNSRRETPTIVPDTRKLDCRTFLRQTLCILVQQPTPEFQLLSAC